MDKNNFILYFKQIFNRINLFALFTFIYLVLLVLKLNGYFDYSAKYDIQSIICSELYENEYFIIDNDDKTTWGLLKKHQENESFIIRFKKQKDFSIIDIYNFEYKNIKFPSIKIYAGNDILNWKICKYIRSENNEKIHFKFEQSCSGKYLILKYAEKQEGFWPITEIKINEE